jgi:hypothetical protein
MDLKSIARQYAEMITSRDIDISHYLKNICAEHVRLFYNGRYIEGISDVIAHIVRSRIDAVSIQQAEDRQFNSMNIYQDGDTVIIEFQITRPLDPPAFAELGLEVIKFDREKIVVIHGYYLDSHMSEDILRMHNALKTPR